MNSLTPPGDDISTLRPVNVLVYSWSGGSMCVDLTRISPLVAFGSGAFIVGHAATKAAENKLSNHEKACQVNQHNFIPFAFDTFGFLASDIVFSGGSKG